MVTRAWISVAVAIASENGFSLLKSSSSSALHEETAGFGVKLSG